MYFSVFVFFYRKQNVWQRIGFNLNIHRKQIYNVRSVDFVKNSISAYLLETKNFVSNNKC